MKFKGSYRYKEKWGYENYLFKHDISAWYSNALDPVNPLFLASIKRLDYKNTGWCKVHLQVKCVFLFYMNCRYSYAYVRMLLYDVK